MSGLRHPKSCQPVPESLILGLRALIRERGKAKAAKALGCGDGTLEDATSPGARVRPEIIEKLTRRLEEISSGLPLDAGITKPVLPCS